MFFVGIVGLCLGSFVNALVWRVHEQDELQEKKPSDMKKRLKELSITKGRSVCPHCNHQLAGKDLVPVFSWLTLRGRCRYCKQPISWQYPLVETLTAVIAVVSYLIWPYVHGQWGGAEIAAFAVWLLVLTGLMALIVSDIKWFLLPDRIVLPVTLLGLVLTVLITINEGSLGALLWPLLAAVLIAGLFFALYQISNGAWIGGGDVKLASVLGLLAGGVPGAFLLLFMASVLGTFYSLLLMLFGSRKISRKTLIPFGPFLITAAIIVFLAGEQIITAYSNAILSI